MNKFERFCSRHSKYGIRNLMMYIILGSGVVFLLSLLPGGMGELFVSKLMFSWGDILRGEVWRVVTFMLIPPIHGFSITNLLFITFTLYFYHMIGLSLEREWGTLSFTIFYFSGAIATAAVSAVLGVACSANYINLSLLFAFATLFPDYEIFLFMLIRVKIKYMAMITAGLLILFIAFSSFPYMMIPIVSLLNYFVFFFGTFKRMFIRNREVSSKIVDFRQSVRQAKESRGYSHICVICGRTDVSNPELEFRYCSKCSGYACFCSDHISDHEHLQA